MQIQPSYATAHLPVHPVGVQVCKGNIQGLGNGDAQLPVEQGFQIKQMTIVWATLFGHSIVILFRLAEV